MKHIGILIFYSLFFSFSYQNESIYTQHGNTPKNCNKLDDIIEDDNLNLFQELLECEIEKNDHCQKSQRDSYECKEHLHGIFFNKNFSSIDYAYSQDRFNLTRFLMQNLNFISQDDPDFINKFVFTKFFKAQVYSVVLEELADQAFYLDPNIQIYNILFQHLNMLFSMDKDNTEYLQAIRQTRCYIFNQFLNIYYITSFSLNGKLQFQWYYEQLQRSSKEEVLDMYIQLMNNNVFVFGGPEETSADYKKDQNNLKKPNIQFLQLKSDQVDWLAKTVREAIMDKELKQRLDLQTLSQLFKSSIEEFQKFDGNEGKSFPILFGSDQFEGLQNILMKLDNHQCLEEQVVQFKIKVSKDVRFIDKRQRDQILGILDNYLSKRKDQKDILIVSEKPNEKRKQDL